MSGAYLSPYMYPNPYMFLFPSLMPGGIAQGAIEELFSSPILIAL
ncbi:hypothetical protein Goklo_029114 [Gossypium klotzschianum]|uniref:Uncharacterized protein n=1 Tax=Gossypium klotzschianum TaxID=34286 RepID=A0A7J8W2V8_9ROSI|nr:hypothetical protein [Gossypium klotzschianum]